jgi:hypothetical protein
MQTLGDYVKAATESEKRLSTQPKKIPDYMSREHDWVGFDFDRTLATYHTWGGPGELGQPIAPMVDLLLETYRKNNVKIFTARIWPIIHYDPVTLKTTWDPRANDLSDEDRKIRCNGAVQACRALMLWCDEHLGHRVPLTNVKDIHCLKFYDDIAVQVVPNTGMIVQ